MVLFRGDESRWRPYRAAARSGLIIAALALAPLDARPAEQEPAKAPNESNAASQIDSGAQSAAATSSERIAKRASPGAEQHGDAAADKHEGVDKSFFDFTMTDALLALFTFGLWVTSIGQHNRLRDTINQMRRTEERQLRAYVAVASLGMRNTSKIRKWCVHSSIRNMGKTPAKDTTFGHAVVVRDYPPPKDIATSVIRIENLGTSEDIYLPGAEALRPQAQVIIESAEDIRAIRNQTKAIYYIVALGYTDIFDNYHTTIQVFACWGREYLRGGHFQPVKSIMS